MSRSRLFVLLFCLLSGVGLAGCSGGSTPTPTPAPQAPPLVINQPAATAAPTPALTATDNITLAPFTIALPSPWTVLRPTAAAWTSQIAQIQAKNPQFAHYLATLTTASAGDQALALAWSPAKTTDLTLVAAVVPAGGLTLQSYLAAAQEELEQSRLVVGAGLTVKSAAIRYDLHEDHLPLATLHYTLPIAPAAGQSEAGSTGYQAVMLDKTGTQLLLLTFVVHDPQPEAGLALIHAIVAKVHEE